MNKNSFCLFSKKINGYILPFIDGEKGWVLDIDYIDFEQFFLLYPRCRVS
jgi:hypothetical protein